MNWSKLSLLLLGVGILFVLLGGPLYSFTLNAWGSFFWRVVGTVVVSGYGWIPAIGGLASAYYLAAVLMLTSYIAALVSAYRTGDGKQDVIFIGTISAICIVALFVPGAAWAATGLYTLALVLLWK